MDQRLLARIAVLYPACFAALGATAEEDTITINLVSALMKDTEVRQLFHYIEFQYQPTAVKNGVLISLGIIDMAAFRDQDRELYLAFECKRLNVHWNGSRHSLAGKYVKEGLVKFSQQQYCRGLPIGWMLGYVMDGDVPHAKTCLFRAIKQYSELTALINGPKSLPADSTKARFSTLHAAGESTILVQHALL